MSKKDYIGLGKEEYRVERLIEKQTRLIKEARGTQPFPKRKKSKFKKRITKLQQERINSLNRLDEMTEISRQKRNPDIEQ